MIEPVDVRIGGRKFFPTQRGAKNISLSIADVHVKPVNILIKNLKKRKKKIFDLQLEILTTGSHVP